MITNGENFNIQKPIDQPACVNNAPAIHTHIYPIAGVPQTTVYSTNLESVFIQHLSRHQGEQMGLMTTAGRIDGVLAGVAVDHIQINLKDRSLHIRISEIVYFEGPLASYR